ncbi:hypothetical protein D1872_261580 [compost metagenome]
MCPFLLSRNETSADVTVMFEEPYPNEHYVLVAMTNQPAYYVTIKEQSRELAVVEITRLKESHFNYGYITWIAIGSLD